MDVQTVNNLNNPTESHTSAPEAGAPLSKAKKRKKVRSVWISFVGRVVAQFVGSAATIVLGLILLHKYQPSSDAQAKDEKVVAKAGPETSAAAVVPAVARPIDDRSIAVLPFLSLAADPNQRYAADSMTEVLTARLAESGRLHVASRTSAMSIGAESKPIPEIARALGVRYVLEGSVAQAQGKVRITAQLIDAARDEHVWARSFDRPTRDMLAVQQEVADLVATASIAAMTNAPLMAVATIGAP